VSGRPAAIRARAPAGAVTGSGLHHGLAGTEGRKPFDRPGEADTGRPVATDTNLGESVRSEFAGGRRASPGRIGPAALVTRCRYIGEHLDPQLQLKDQIGQAAPWVSRSVGARTPGASNTSAGSGVYQDTQPWLAVDSALPTLDDVSCA
jgi:hypothetical protein